MLFSPSFPGRIWRSKLGIYFTAIVFPWDWWYFRWFRCLLFLQKHPFADSFLSVLPEKIRTFLVLDKTMQIELWWKYIPLDMNILPKDCDCSRLWVFEEELCDIGKTLSLEIHFLSLSYFLLVYMKTVKGYYRKGSYPYVRFFIELTISTLRNLLTLNFLYNMQDLPVNSATFVFSMI